MSATLSRIWLAAAFLAGAVYIARAGLALADPAIGTDALLVEFAVFWAAAKLLLAGNGIDAYDADLLWAAIGYPAGYDPGGGWVWSYPPAMQLLVAPFGLLPFGPAFALFDALSLGAFWLALRPWLSGPGTRLVLAAPAVLYCLSLGVPSLLLAALLAAAAGRPAGQREGIAAGLLSLKPTLGIALPFAWAAGGHWRAFGTAAIATIALHGLALAVLGPAHLRAFLDMAALSGERLAEGFYREHLMVTWFAFTQQLGLPVPWALRLQLAVTLALLAATIWLWRRPAPHPAKAAALAFAAPLATPYAFHYELIFGLVGIVFLSHAGLLARPAGRMLAALVWAAPLVVLAGLGTWIWTLGAPLLTAGFAASLWLGRR